MLNFSIRLSNTKYIAMYFVANFSVGSNFLGTLTPSRDNNQGVLKDICDGNLYQQLLKSHACSAHDDCILLTFMFNTDGVPIFKSSNFSVWPLLLSINELPFHARYV